MHLLWCSMTIDIERSVIRGFVMTIQVFKELHERNVSI
jgi:hypothetical protein